MSSQARQDMRHTQGARTPPPQPTVPRGNRRHRPAGAITSRPTCPVDDAVPGCDAGPAGRLSFVVREAHAAWRRHRTATSTPPDHQTDPSLGGTR